MILVPDTQPPLGHRSRIRLGAVILAWGLQAIVTQSLLLREAQVLMFGSEFAWGVVLFAWLFGVAIGAAVGGWAASRLRRPDLGLVVVLVALSIAACAELWIFRGARAWLGVEPGELLPLPRTAMVAMLFISPTSALVGMAFPLACCIPGVRGEEEPVGVGPLGKVYALESAGSLMGGAAFSFWAVEHLAPIEIALVCGMVTVAACAGFLAAARRGPAVPILLAAGAVGALLLTVSAGDELNRRLVDRRWRNVAAGYELIAAAESKYQNLAIGRRADQFTLYCDGQVSVDFPDPYTFVPLAHFWMCQHPEPRRVLVLGGGAEGLLAEILRHPVEHVDYVEPDPRLIELIEPYLSEQDRKALRDAHVTVHHVDARYFVKTQRGRFDLVIARLPEPTSALRARFYTDEFYRELRRAMARRSVLCTTVAATPANLSQPSAEYLASIRATLARHFPEVTVGWGDPAHVLAATQAGLVSTDPGELTARYSNRRVQSDLFHPLWFEGATDWLDADKVQQRAEQLDAVRHAEISTDLRPVVYVQRLALWERMTGGGSVSVMGRLRAVTWTQLIVGLVGIGGIAILYSFIRNIALKPSTSTGRTPWASTSAIILSVGTTGFATMALSIVWLFAFQNLYGYVYQRIGWIIAVFMGGLVVGCGWVSWWSRHLGERQQAEPRGHAESRAAALGSHLWRWLITVDVLIALLALLAPFALPALGAMQSTPLTLVLVEWAVLLMVALTGVLGGAAFALAGGLQLATYGRAGSAAGSVVGADHAGACLGALFTGVLLVPVFGTAAAAYLLAGIKLTSAGLVLIGWRLSRAYETSHER